MPAALSACTGRPASSARSRPNAAPSCVTSHGITVGAMPGMVLPAGSPGPRKITSQVRPSPNSVSPLAMHRSKKRGNRLTTSPPATISRSARLRTSDSVVAIQPLSCSTIVLRRKVAEFM